MAPPAVNGPWGSGLFANLPLKASALAIAIGLYAVAHGTEDAQQTFSVPLVATLPRTDLILAEPLPPTILVSLRGPRTKLRDLRAEGIPPITLDAQSLTVDRVELDGSQIDLPAGVRVERMEPGEVSFHWEKALTRILPVRLSLGDLPAGLVFDGAPSIEPAKVTVRGLARKLNTLQATTTDVVHFYDSFQGYTERDVGLVLPDGLLGIEPSHVLVKFTLRHATTVQLFPKVAIAVVGFAAAKTQPTTVAVRFECPVEAPTPARAEDLVAFVRPSDAHVDLAEVQVEKGPCHVEVTPSRVIVRH